MCSSDLALQSQNRAASAQRNGYFSKSIVEIKDRTGLTILNNDEHVRPDSTFEGLSQLSPSFFDLGESGFDAMAMKIRSGLEDIIVAGGVESMSRVPMGHDDGPILYDPDVVGKINYIPQGVAADLIATIEGFSREQVDAYALQSQQRAASAQRNGYFSKSIVEIKDRTGLTILNHDEHVRDRKSVV